MDSNRIKKAAEWFYNTVFRDEAIRPKSDHLAEKLPPMLRTARSLENRPTNAWQSREAIFLKQAKLLANYEDDYTFHGSVVHYYPTYQSLTDPELRGYFSWRTQLRKANMQKTSLTFCFLYIYELINQIGVSEPQEGYRMLVAFRDQYGVLDERIVSYLDRWIMDYVIYYELDANLIATSKQVLFDRSVCVLDQIYEQSEDQIMDALRQLAPKWLSRSKFYGAHQADFHRVTARVLQRASHHYATHTKKTMVEQFFGIRQSFPIKLFDTAIFCDPMKKRNLEYVVDERCVYRCQNGLWTVIRHPTMQSSNKKLEDILKTIDAVMREEYSYKYPIQSENNSKWLHKIIHEEIQALLAEKKAAEGKKISIDYAQLAKIRREAALTQEKLTVDEDDDEVAEQPVLAEVPVDVASSQDSLLTGPEYRLLQCLLYGKSIHWVRSDGHLLSVLVDGINEKLYDTFMDSVLDDTPELIEDYIEELKEMVTP